MILAGVLLFSAPQAEQSLMFQSDARLAREAFVGCLLRKREKAILKLLDQPVDAPATRVGLEKSVTDMGCVESILPGKGIIGIGVKASHLRGSVYEALLKRDRTAVADDFSAAPPLRLPMTDGTTDPSTKDYQMAMSAAECIVRAQPAEALTFTRSEIKTPAENAAFEALKPTFPKCIDRRTSFRLPGIAEIKGAVAEAYYRMRAAKRGAAA